MRTMCAYVAGIVHFPHWLADKHIGLSKIDEIVIRRFLKRHLPRCCGPQYHRRAIINCGVALGHLLKYLRLHGQVASAPPPKIPALVERLFAAFDRSSPVGQRDFAIARCLVDLGLRGAEVPRLTLADIDWRQGTICVHGKGRRTDLLPLPKDLGRAITRYLRHGRPATTSRALFVRQHAPLDAAITAAIVRKIIRNTAQRCGIAACCLRLDRRMSGFSSLVSTMTLLKLVQVLPNAQTCV